MNRHWFTRVFPLLLLTDLSKVGQSPASTQEEESLKECFSNPNNEKNQINHKITIFLKPIRELTLQGKQKWAMPCS